MTIEPSPEPGGAKPGGEADLVRDLQQRVSLLEAQAQAAAPVGASRQGISARSVLMVVGLLLATVLAVGLVFVAWGAITLVLIALLSALALSPAVDFFVARGLGRGLAVGGRGRARAWAAPGPGLGTRPDGRGPAKRGVSDRA